jgi:hypothetical protein
MDSERVEGSLIDYENDVRWHALLNLIGRPFLEINGIGCVMVAFLSFWNVNCAQVENLGLIDPALLLSVQACS